MSTTDPNPSASAAFGLPRRFLRQLLFLALAGNEDTHGYELAETVRQNGLAVDMAGVYRELRRMEQHNLVMSHWEPSDNGGPDRRVYTLTESGLAAVRSAVRELTEARDLLTAALDTVAVDTATAP